MLNNDKYYQAKCSKIMIDRFSEIMFYEKNRSIKALKNLDTDEAKKIISDNLLIDKKRWDTDEKCITLIATQQPVATELRELIAILNITTELEHMGDHAEGIAKIVIMHGNKLLVKPLIDIPQMEKKQLLC